MRGMVLITADRVLAFSGEARRANRGRQPDADLKLDSHYTIPVFKGRVPYYP